MPFIMWIKCVSTSITPPCLFSGTRSYDGCGSLVSCGTVHGSRDVMHVTHCYSLSPVMERGNIQCVGLNMIAMILNVIINLYNLYSASLPTSYKHHINSDFLNVRASLAAVSNHLPARTAVHHLWARDDGIRWERGVRTQPVPEEHCSVSTSWHNVIPPKRRCLCCLIWKPGTS